MTQAVVKPTSKNKADRSAQVNCRIIGVLDDALQSLSQQSINYINQANIIIGGSRTLRLFQSHFSNATEQFDLTGNLSKIPQWITTAQKNKQQIIVLATGDPLCHGIAKYIHNKIDSATCEIIPNVSTIQLACARLGLTWHDIKICSIHSKDTGEWQIGADTSHGLYKLLQLTQQYDKLAVFTSPENSPTRIAKMLKLEGFELDFTITVVQNILHENETTLGPMDINKAAQSKFSDLNITILQRCKLRTEKLLFGRADQSFKQRKPDKGLITKREVRAVSLSRMQLTRNSIVWDIGAGSGSVGLEAAMLCPNGHIYAIEKNIDDFAIANQNKISMQVTNYTLINAKAPSHIEHWPSPNAIFVGGSGGELAELISICITRMLPSACLVMNFVTIENMATAVATLKEIKDRHNTEKIDYTIEWDATQLSAARSKPILHMNRLQAENPVWIVTVQKKLLHRK
ncbi:Cobalt-precorrin-7 (C5)-methyltransferase / Cobalt-precorrin-6B C15-methyltransferase [decarboxylating] [hydrothermal vent metagenome]|uniref:Cobalt-precorrin-7 (C5)-methyltransferase / Cobalt-precorrin-6B C15-methyltransferase [decarboxylating] n=1 Tax=hydrothermal vent metagenome TaxID=652676 RepID=A0A3B1A3L2_9ZZZZ